MKCSETVCSSKLLTFHGLQLYSRVFPEEILHRKGGYGRDQETKTILDPKLVDTYGFHGPRYNHVVHHPGHSGGENACDLHDFLEPRFCLTSVPIS